MSCPVLDAFRCLAAGKSPSGSLPSGPFECHALHACSPYSQMPFVFFHSHIQHLLVFVLLVIPRGVSQLLSPTMPLKVAWLLTKLDVLYRAGLFEQGRGALKKLTGNLVPSSSPPQLYNRSSARLAELYGHESEGDEGDETPRWVSDRVLQTCSAALFVMATTTFLLNPHPFPACLGSKQHRTYASSVQPQLLRRPFLVLLTSTDLTPVLPPPVQEYATNISCFCVVYGHAVDKMLSN